MPRTANTMEVVANKNELLAKLKENMSRHKEIVGEARKGYMEKAKKELRKKLELLERGEVTAVSIHLAPPEDHTDDYRVAVQMLELHTEGTIRLAASDVQCFVMDEWG
jgi:hypothetical protein